MRITQRQRQRRATALFRDNLNDIYEDLILNNDGDFQPPDDIIDSLVTCISAANMQHETNISMGPTELLYLFEFSRIHNIGGIASPYAFIEWPGV